MQTFLDNDEWFRRIESESHLPENAARQLRYDGFVVIESPWVNDKLTQLSDAYDMVMATAHPDNVSVRSSIRVSDFVNRGREFDGLYIYEPILAACCQIIGQPFKLSTMHARTLPPDAPTQPLHVDFRRDSEGYPMIGFIVMIDEFRNDNGATRFIPGTQDAENLPEDVLEDVTAECEGQVLAQGSAGSIIIYNGSIWHGHTANRSAKPRRSIQGAFIRRNAQSAINQAARIRPETLHRIGHLAKHLLDLETT